MLIYLQSDILISFVFHSNKLTYIHHVWNIRAQTTWKMSETFRFCFVYFNKYDFIQVKKTLTISRELVEVVNWRKTDRECNDKKTHNGPQNTIKKCKDWATRTWIKTRIEVMSNIWSFRTTCTIQVRTNNHKRHRLEQKI
jgi:hypothetical protein